jgi:hypothetical protein
MHWRMAGALFGAVTVLAGALVPMSVLAAEPGAATSTVHMPPLPPPCVYLIVHDLGVSGQLRSALDGAGISATTATANLRGSVCHPRESIMPAGHPNGRELLNIEVPTDGAADNEAVGNLAVPVIDALEPLMQSDIMASRQWIEVNITLRGPTQAITLSSSWGRLLAARQQGLTGAALVKASPPAFII